MSMKQSPQMTSTAPYVLTQEQITNLAHQNESLKQQLSRAHLQCKKLGEKYEKALQQLALIVRANETLKKDYDYLESHMNALIQEKTEASKAKMKEYLRNDLDQLNKTIERLNEDKDKLELESSSLKMKLNAIGQEKAKLLKDNHDLQAKYQALENQLQQLDPETRDNNSRTSAVKDLKQKARLVDELQLMIQNLQEQKQSIHKQYQQQLGKIELLWNEWREFQRELNISEHSHMRLSEGEGEHKRKRRGSVIFEEGMAVIKGKGKERNEGKERNVRELSQEQIISRQVQILIDKLKEMQSENTQLKSVVNSAEVNQRQVVQLQINQRQVVQLKKINQKLTEQKLVAEQKLSQTRIKHLMQQASQQNRQAPQQNRQSEIPQQGRLSNDRIAQSSVSNNKSAEDDLVSILRDLHQQLSPLRHELTTLKKQHMQQSQSTSAERASFQVKLIRLQKQLSFHKQHNDLLKRQLSQLKSEKQLISQLTKKLQQTEQQKSLLEGKLIVMETLNVADRTRVDGDTYAVLKEFERRMELVVQGDTHFMKQIEGNHLQHLVAMKAYILELDQRLKKLGVQNDKLHKKYAYSKEKVTQLSLEIKELSGGESMRILMYKQKLQAYDKLVSKMTLELQKHISKNQLSFHTHTYHMPSNPQSRLTSQTHQYTTSQPQSPQQRGYPTHQINQVISLYQEKMINMGEEIVRVRGDKQGLERDKQGLERDKQGLEREVKELRQKLSERIREINERERELVTIKTENITLSNHKNSLEKEIAEMKQLNESHFSNSNILQEQAQVNLQPKGHIEQQQQYEVPGDSSNSQHELNQLKEDRQTSLINRIKQQYEEENIASVELAIAKHQEIVEQMAVEHQNQLEANLDQIRQKQEIISQKQEIIHSLHAQLQELHHQLQSLANQPPSTHHQETHQMHQNEPQSQPYQSDPLHSPQQQPQQSESLDPQLVLSQQHIARLTKQKQSLFELLKAKDSQLRQLQQAILKNNQEITQLRNEKKRTQYSQIQTQHLLTQQTHQLIEQNTRLNSSIFELNVKISGLQSIKYNFKLQNQILRGDCEFMQDRLNSIDGDNKMKNSTIFHLENDLRNYASSFDSTIMAKDSLIRSYENEIKNLKHALEDIKSIMEIEKEQLVNRIRELQSKLKLGESTTRQHESMEGSRHKMQVNNTIVQHSNNSSITNNKRSNQSSSQFEHNTELITTLQQKIDNLQSQLKSTQQQLLTSSQQIAKLQHQTQNINNFNNPSMFITTSNLNNPTTSNLNNPTTQVYGLNTSQESNSNISVYWEEEMDKLNGQVLTLRSTIITLKDQIQFKEQKISQLKHQIYKLKMKLASFQANHTKSQIVSIKQSPLVDKQLPLVENDKHNNKNQSNQQKSQVDNHQQGNQSQAYSNSPRKSPIDIISNQPITSHQTVTELQQQLTHLNQQLTNIQHQLSHVQLQNKQLLINQTHQTQTITFLQAQMRHLNQQNAKLNFQISHLTPEINHYRTADSQINLSIMQELQKLKHNQTLDENQKCKLLADDIQKMETAIYQIKNQYELQISTLKNNFKTLEHDIHSKDLKISELTRTLLQTRISTTDSHSTTNQPQPTEQSSPDITYLLLQIQRQTELISAKQLELTQTATLLTKLQSEKSRANQNLALIVLLIVQIESLRNQLQQAQLSTKKGHSETIEGSKMSRNASRQLNTLDEERQKANFSLIKILQCSHEHLINYEKMLLDKRNQPSSRNSITNEMSRTESQIADPLTQTIIKSSQKIIEESQGHSSESLMGQSPAKRVSIKAVNRQLQNQLMQSGDKGKHIEDMKSQYLLSLPSQSNNSSVQNIDSTYSIKNPFRNYYRHAVSTYNPNVLSPPSKRDNDQTSPARTMKINPKPINLGSFGKISESHNIESSYGSIQSQSSGSHTPVYNDGYSYTLKNVNMIQSVGQGNSSGSKNSAQKISSESIIGLGPDYTTNNQTSYYMYKDPERKYGYSFGKPTEMVSNSSLAQVESRYVVEKRSGFGPGESVLSRGSIIPLSTELKPMSTSNTHIDMGSSGMSSYPFTSSYNQPLTNSYIVGQSSSSNISSNSYLPTYSNDSSLAANQYNKGNSYLPSGGLFSTNLTSTLANTSAAYQQYMTKPI